MKLRERNLKVKLESPDGDAILTFKPIRANTQLKIQVAISDAKESGQSVTTVYQEVLSNCISIENLEDDKGAVTLSQLQAMDLPFDVVQAIVLGYL